MGISELTWIIGMGILLSCVVTIPIYIQSRMRKGIHNPFEGKIVEFVSCDKDEENADGVRGHLRCVGDCNSSISFYDKYIKRIFDVILSTFGVLVLSPIFLGISLAIVINDPGPIFFKQKRIGKNKTFFYIYKFRSMKMSTPHDIPTHMLDNPQQYITKVGAFLRAHSLDELPQLFNVLDGSLSLVGPRPALWNQDLLIAERDKYGANDLKPGITGWAQINGRDSIAIEDKARLDGYWKEHHSFWFDLKCILGTVSKVGHDSTVVEGGTATIEKGKRNYTEGKTDDELIGYIGFEKCATINREDRKCVLITGEGSYVGNSFITYVKQYYPENFVIEELNTMDKNWRNYDFTRYDIVYHVAGIAHADIGDVSEDIKEKYYVVNTDLAIEVAKKSKESGVKEFVFMSSMIIYGESAPYRKEKVIDENTIPTPANFYGDSKLQADVAVRMLASSKFKVIVIRPPMIYGKGSKGNYSILSSVSKKLPFFPDVDNSRSMIYIDNFCEFVAQVMLVENVTPDAIVVAPQNAKWIKTSDMVKEIADVAGNNILMVKGMRFAVVIGRIIPGKIGKLINKVFGNNCYAHEMSLYDGIDYQAVDFHNSIVMTESHNR